MKACYIFVFISLFLFTSLQAQNAGTADYDIYSDSFAKLYELRQKVKDLHPALNNFYPIAIYKDTTLTIFEPDEESNYKFIKEVRSSRPLHPKIMAAFPLGENDNKMTCVVHDKIFDYDVGYIFIFHEFLHCYQFGTVELGLKSELTVHQNAMASKNYMWEITHPFPYDDPKFEEFYSSLLEAAAQKNMAAVKTARTKLREYLGKEDFEYMAWQEWKEGSARWIENKIRNRFSVEENNFGTDKPYSRVSFYASGALLIDMLNEVQHEILTDLEALYHIIHNL
ncbi:hypothetical protein ACFLR4_00270 [Bacteroidota bacterium]